MHEIMNSIPITLVMWIVYTCYIARNKLLLLTLWHKVFYLVVFHLSHAHMVWVTGVSTNLCCRWVERPAELHLICADKPRPWHAAAAQWCCVCSTYTHTFHSLNKSYMVQRTKFWNVQVLFLELQLWYKIVHNLLTANCI